MNRYRAMWQDRIRAILSLGLVSVTVFSVTVFFVAWILVPMMSVLKGNGYLTPTFAEAVLWIRAVAACSAVTTIGIYLFIEWQLYLERTER